MNTQLFKRLLIGSSVTCALLSGCSATDSSRNDAATSNYTPSASAPAGKTIVLPNLVNYAENASVPQAVKDECNTPNQFADFLKTFSQANGYTVVSADQANSNTLVLDVEIDQVHAPAGGAWSGPKFVIASGTLQKNGEQLGDFKVRRTTTGGAFAVFKGVCSLVGRDVKTMSKDISTWLDNPATNSRLGEL